MRANGFAYPAMDLALEWLPGCEEPGHRHCRYSPLAPLRGCRRDRRGAGRAWRRGADGGQCASGDGALGRPAAVVRHRSDRLCRALGDDDPVVVDISLSKVARGKIMAAAQKGEAIPEGWALDPDGQPTTDAKAAMAGTMIPLGDAKGTALALMVELLCAGPDRRELRLAGELVL
jgi:(2R)-3-sulfolactate dehydrogenase (NADP+)